MKKKSVQEKNLYRKISSWWILGFRIITMDRSRFFPSRKSLFLLFSFPTSRFHKLSINEKFESLSPKSAQRPNHICPSVHSHAERVSGYTSYRVKVSVKWFDLIVLKRKSYFSVWNCVGKDRTTLSMRSSWFSCASREDV